MAAKSRRRLAVPCKKMKAAPLKKNVFPEAPSDEDLMALTAGGDHGAFTILAERYAALLYAAAWRLCSDRTMAEDAVQESLVRLWTKAAEWDAGKGASVRTWLYRIACNLCIDMLRRKKWRAVELLDDVAAAPGSAEADVQAQETGRIVARAVRELPERQRMALVLCHYQEMSNAEVAVIMGVSAKGVESLLVRARRSLRRKLEKHRGSIETWT